MSRGTVPHSSSGARINGNSDLMLAAASRVLCDLQWSLCIANAEKVENENGEGRR